MNTGDWLSFTVAPARERSLSPCSPFTDEKEVVAAERILTLAIGIALQDELIDQMDKVNETMKKSFMNLNFNHREQIKYSYDFFNNPEGPIMGELKDTKILLQREEIKGVVLKSIAIAIAAKMKTNKKN